MSDSEDSYLTGARENAPLAVGVAIYGLAFGMLATQAGFSPFGIAGMGVVAFAGTSQIVFTQQWLAGASALAALGRKLSDSASAPRRRARRRILLLRWRGNLTNRGVALGDNVGRIALRGDPGSEAFRDGFCLLRRVHRHALKLFRGRADIAPWVVSVGVVLLCAVTGWLAAPWALVLGGVLGAAAAGVFGHD